MTTRHVVIAFGLAVAGLEVHGAATAPVPQEKPATRRSERLLMPALEVASPNGQVTLRFLPIDPSPLVLNLDGYDLSAGVVMSGVVRDEVKEATSGRAFAATALSHSNRATLSLTDDLTSTAYTLEVRVFDDGVA